MQKFLILMLLLCAAYSSPASSGTDFRFHKVYAGLTNNDSTVRREARKNARNGLSVPDLTVIECKRGASFGVAILISPHDLNYVSVTRTWFHSHLEKSKGRDRHTRSNILRKSSGDKFGLRYVQWRLDDDELIDGDFKLALYNDDGVYLRHIFQIRGCEALTAAEVTPDAQVAAVAPPELLHRLQSWIDGELLVERPYISRYEVLSIDSQPILDSLDTIAIQVDPSTTYVVSKTGSQLSPLGGTSWSGTIVGQKDRSVSIHVSENGESVIKIRTGTESGLVMIRPTPILPYHIAYWRAVD